MGGGADLSGMVLLMNPFITGLEWTPENTRYQGLI